MTNFTNWTKRDNALWMDEYTDVSVEFVADQEGNPFVGRVGSASYAVEFLDDAMDWCSQVAHGRAIITGPDPLPGPDDTEFLAERGLTG
jgi:hypothetical protein